jgi:hypothetical protein
MISLDASLSRLTTLMATTLRGRLHTRRHKPRVDSSIRPPLTPASNWSAASVSVSPMRFVRLP